ncbi:MAG: hypothetical protein NTX03_00460 [Bacteroidetes bacterium]|nr:hypothetical protein [Bacteroidota bacterium]
MKIILTKITWRKSKPLPMIALARQTVTDMTGDPDYPMPKVPLPEMTTAANLAENTYNTRKNGQAAKEAYTLAIDDLDFKMHSQAIYVNSIAAGDALKISGSGFTPTNNNRVPAVIPAAPAAFTLTPIFGGKLKIDTQLVAGARSYTYVIFVNGQMAVNMQGDKMVIPPGAAELQIFPSSPSRITMEGLTPGTNVFVGVIACNAAGISPMSIILSTHII